jgi:hypothetical protein
MPRMQKYFLEDVHKTKIKRHKKGKIQERYKNHILSLKEGEAGGFKTKDDKDAFTLRARIKRAAKALGMNVKVRKRGDRIYFWREDK